MSKFLGCELNIQRREKTEIALAVGEKAKAFAQGRESVLITAIRFEDTEHIVFATERFEAWEFIEWLDKKGDSGGAKPVQEEEPLSKTALLAQNGDRKAYRRILEQFKPVIHGRIKKKSYFLPAKNHEDLFQEGLVGLYKAIQSFDESKAETKNQSCAFEVFAKICIDRALISAIKNATRKNHAPLNGMVSLDRSLKENDNLSMMDIFSAREEGVKNAAARTILSPAEEKVLEETLRMQEETLKRALSEKEKTVYNLYLEDKSYNEIMQDLNVQNPKMIDNAIQRVKRKIALIKNGGYEEALENEKRETMELALSDKEKLAHQIHIGNKTYEEGLEEMSAQALNGAIRRLHLKMAFFNDRKREDFSEDAYFEWEKEQCGDLDEENE